MDEESSRKSSRKSCKSNSEEVEAATRNQWAKRKFTCNWNMTCKALVLGLTLMFAGASMATIGYFVDQIYTTKDKIAGNETTEREKGRVNFATYVGPMIMGVGGFIVVAACVMTFEQRDNATKVVPNRLHLSSQGHSMTRHTKSSPSTRFPAREGSGRRQNPPTGYYIDGVEDFTRRDLTADFIQFSRNLQQAKIERSLTQHVLGRSPSAPNLAASVDLPGLSPRSGSPRYTKYSRNSLHPLIGQPFLSPHMLHRQALSMDNPDYQPHLISPPRSKRSSRQSSTSVGKGSAESLDAETSRRSHTSQASMILDLHMPNDCPISMKIRDRNRRSDTARRHLLVRQAQIESEEDAAEREPRSGSPQFGPRCSFRDERFDSSSTPHSRGESYSPRMVSMEDATYHQRYRLTDVVLRCSSPSLQVKRGKYLRSNTISNESAIRRGSQTSAAELAGRRKGSADYHYHSRRKSSTHTSAESSRYCSRINFGDDKKQKRSPTSSMKSFQELRYISQKLNEQERGKQTHRKRKENTSRGGQQMTRKISSTRAVHQSLSPDSLSISSNTTEGHSKSEFTSIEVEPSEEDVSRMA